MKNRIERIEIATPEDVIVLERLAGILMSTSMPPSAEILPEPIRLPVEIESADLTDLPLALLVKL